MRKLFVIILLVFAAGCSQPFTVTANPDDHGSTSGTMGSVKSSNQLPDRVPVNTTKTDSIKIPRDTSKFRR